MGDVNGDGAVTAIDSNYIKRYIVFGSISFAPVEFAERADVNGDGAITAMDSYIIKLLLRGIEID